MIIGVPRETKADEYRVAMLPVGVSLLAGDGHTVLVERGAGTGSGFDDDQYAAAGAELVDGPEEIFTRCEMIVKVKEPVEPADFVIFQELPQVALVNRNAVLKHQPQGFGHGSLLRGLGARHLRTGLNLYMGVTPQHFTLEGEYVPPTPEEAAKVDAEELQMQLKDVIDKLGNIDKPTWYGFCKDKGAEDPEALTEAMAEAGCLKIESTKISKIDA